MKDQLQTYPDLASEHLGGVVVYATNDTLGKKENLNTEKSQSTKVSKSSETNFDSWLPNFKGKTKEWAVIRLGCEANIVGFEIRAVDLLSDHALQISIDAIHFKSNVEDWQLADFLDWDVILKNIKIDTIDKNYFQCNVTKPYTHVRLHLLSEGAISRCKVFGKAYKDWSIIKDNEQLDLAVITHGGKILANSTTYSGSAQNLIAPKKSSSVTDGWYSKDKLTNDSFGWVIIKLAHRGFIEKLIIDTYNFYEHRAESCSIDYCIASNDQDVLDDNVSWQNLLEKKGLKPHRENPFSGKDIKDHEAITHVKLKIYSFGGLSRLRLIGTIKK